MILKVNQIGKGNRPLVLLHGWGFNQKIWQSLIPLLTNNFTLYLVDLPGFGQSTMMSWSLFKEQLLSKLPEKFAVLGWSLGGLFATKLAIEEHERVSHLLNVTTSPYFVQDTEWPGITPQTLEQFFINLSQNPKQTTEEFIALQLQNFSSSVANLGEFSSNLEALTNGLTILASWDLRPCLPGLKSPTCFMFGRLDAIVPRHLLPRMQELYPQFNYILFPKAAHMPFISHQQDFIKEVEKFLL
ncbi:biotin operon repressor and biotin [Legionella beliardensis]|uniref:Pimeloyl-[acyl-carrier protein] methyl ester esterase n=1 Tax=Legionella beliardensis TaxID=91822 RepID=A0A378I2N3_9GAMM|nr:alpha/beta fold hydrolase [Legionella beliardensis]STX28926.1 biotin operon repressor and biotin [Legionella beliardensis]